MGEKGTSQVTFELEVRKDGAAVLTQPLSYNAAASIISDARDSADNAELFRLAAEHPATDVRENVAYKENLDDGTVEMLAADSCPSVIRSLVSRSAFKRWVPQSRLIEIIKSDPDAAESVAGSVSEYENVDGNALAKFLAGMPDPQIRCTLAGNYSCPKTIAKMLLSDPDPAVRAAAEERISNG